MDLTLQLFEILPVSFLLDIMDDITEICFVGEDLFDIFDLITDGNNIWTDTFYSIAILLDLSLYCF